MYCTNCGQPIETSAQFCIHCGARKTAPQTTNAPDFIPANDRPNVPPFVPSSPKQSNKALPWIIIGSVLGGLLIIIGIINYLYNAPGGLQDAFSNNTVTVGATFHKNSDNLDVTDGQNLQVGQRIYARLETTSRFHTSSIKVMIEEKNGSGWSDYLSKNIHVSPNDSILVAYFVADHANTYHILFIDGSDVLGETNVDVTDNGSNNAPSDAPDDNSNDSSSNGDSL